MLRARTHHALALGAVLTLASLGCNGAIGDDDDGAGASGPGNEEKLDVASAPIRRMTPSQYQNAVRDLLGDPELEIALDDDTGEAFSRLAAEKLNAAVEVIAERESLWQNEVFPCDVSGEEDLACLDGFVRDFGFRAFRRPLFSEETAWLKGVYTAARAEQSFHDSMMVVLEVMLQSPQFLYFLELGRPSAELLPPGVVALNGFERATRLSFFLLDSIPDTELLEAAERGDLDTAAGIRLEAERLLETPRARGLAKRFFTGMLQLDGTTKHASLENVMKSPDVFPMDSPELRTAMRTEIEALVERVVFEDHGNVQDLLTTNDAYVDANLAEIYGVSAPSGDGFGWVTLPESQRAGLLTRAGFLTLYSRGDVKSPIRRGAFVLQNVLCYELGEPPPNANDVTVTGGTVDENGESVRRTVRQDVEAKTMGEGCNGCHHLLNPVGFAFDNFDALGRFTTEEQGEDDAGAYTLPIDSSGSLPNVEEDGGLDGVSEVSGAVEISSAIAASAGLSQCMAKKWFGTALRRTPAEEDARSMARIREALSSGEPIVDVMLEATTSDAFLYLRKESDQ
ncbi:MAG: DUF1592 domain-containing protein [Polyangiaceae bacterium]|nr:DUF1592 domain-containing protein [Polyangiaceae bacterium]